MYVDSFSKSYLKQIYFGHRSLIISMISPEYIYISIYCDICPWYVQPISLSYQTKLLKTPDRFISRFYTARVACCIDLGCCWHIKIKRRDSYSITRHGVPWKDTARAPFVWSVAKYINGGWNYFSKSYNNNNFNIRVYNSWLILKNVTHIWIEIYAHLKSPGMFRVFYYNLLITS